MRRCLVRFSIIYNMMSNKEEGCKHEKVTIQYGEVVCLNCNKVLMDEITVITFK
jgi:hypothetical protein